MYLEARRSLRHPIEALHARVLLLPLVTVKAVTVVEVVDYVVGPGKWTTAGRIVDCTIGFYNPLPGQTDATACLACPEYATTLHPAATVFATP